jgi:MFS family permease
MIVLFGIGVGIFCATDYAIAVDVLDNPAHNGKNMGLWTLALTCPQMVSGPLVGNIIDSFRANDEATTGWIIVMNIMAISVLYGAYLLKYSNIVH